jgi:hypothetical protein
LNKTVKEATRDLKMKVTELNDQLKTQEEEYKMKVTELNSLLKTQDDEFAEPGEDGYEAYAHRNFLQASNLVLQLAFVHPLKKGGLEPVYQEVLESVKNMSTSLSIVTSLQQELIADKKTLSFENNLSMENLLTACQWLGVKVNPENNQGEIEYLGNLGNDIYESKKEEGFNQNVVSLILSTVKALHEGISNAGAQCPMQVVPAVGLPALEQPQKEVNTQDIDEDSEHELWMAISAKKKHANPKDIFADNSDESDRDEMAMVNELADRAASKRTTKPAAKETTSERDEMAMVDEMANSAASKETTKPAAKEMTKPAAKEMTKQAAKATTEETTKQAAKETEKTTKAVRASPTKKPAAKETTKQAAKATTEETTKQAAKATEKTTKAVRASPTKKPAAKETTKQAAKATTEETTKQAAKETEKTTKAVRASPTKKSKDTSTPLKRPPSSPPPSSSRTQRRRKS